MQTFLPYPDPAASAAALDDRRLGKQRVETFQVLRALTWPSYGWKNHPAVAMWRAFVPALVRYGLDVCDAWVARGYADALRPQLLDWTAGREPVWTELAAAGQVPPWFGDPDVHESHRSALVRKLPAVYRSLFPAVRDDLPYAWPEPPFPRWPLRRGHPQPLALDDAAALLGLAKVTAQQRSVVAALRPQDAPGGPAVVPAAGADGPGELVTAHLAALCTPGMTVWVGQGPDLRNASTVGDGDRPTGADATSARAASSPATSPSIAREPTEQDRAAMDAEGRAEPEVRFHPVHRWPDVDLTGAGLVVADGVRLGSPAPDGVPVLQLRPRPRHRWGTDPTAARPQARRPAREPARSRP